MANEEFFSTKQAAEYLGIKVETVKYHIYTSKYLKPIKLGPRTLVFTKEMLDEFKRTVPDPGKPKKPEE